MGKFSSVLRQLRIAKGLTQEELSNALHISRSRLGMWETGNRTPDSETLEMIADYFNVDIDYLLGRTDKTTILPESYYIDEKAREIAEFMHKNPDYSALFDASRKVKPENLEIVKQIIEKFSDGN